MKNQNEEFENLSLDEIVSIELVGEMETIDISVEDTHMFFANDIYTHNSAINESKFDLKVISESLGKAQTADVILGLGRSDDDKASKKAQLMVLKNRNGEDGYTVPLDFDTSDIQISVSLQDSHMGYGGLKDSTPIEDGIRKMKMLPNEDHDDANIDLDPEIV